MKAELEGEHIQALEVEARYTSGVYTKRPLTLVRGRGTRVWDDRGREYLDFATGVGVAAVGHAHPRLVRAIRDQAEQLLVCADAHFYHGARARLLEALCTLAPGAGSSEGGWRAFLCNSGAEAVEAALKFARAHTGRTKVIAAMRGFHGRTLGALSATWKSAYRRPFEPLVPGFRHVPFGDLAALRDVLDGEVAAVILEPVQGEGGVHPAPPGYLQGVRQLCDRVGALLIADEVQTGLGRTGRMFACEHEGVVPDLLCLGKALGGGVPIGAVVFREPIAPKPGWHGSTFGGNPLACAAACAVLEAIEAEGLVARAAETGAYFLQKLRTLAGAKPKAVREARGLGLMLALELKSKAAPVLRALMERGVLALPAGAAVLRFLPPLGVSRGEVDQAVAALEAVL